MHKGVHCSSVYNRRKYKQAKFATIRGVVKYIDIICITNENDLYKEFAMSSANTHTRACKILKSKPQNSITNLVTRVNTPCTVQVHTAVLCGFSERQ